MRTVEKAAVLAVMAALTGCVTAEKDFSTSSPVKMQVEEQAVQDRLDRLLAEHQDIERKVAPVAQRLLSSAGAACADAKSQPIGLTFWNRYLGTGGFVQAASRLYGLGEEIQVKYVWPNSAAATLGIQPGDVLTSINGYRPAEGRNGVPTMEDLLFKIEQTGNPVSMEFRRAGELIKATFTGKPGCAYRFRLKPDAKIDAYIADDTLVMTSAMAEFLVDETEIAMVLGHVLGHATVKRLRPPVDPVTRLALKPINVDKSADVRAFDGDVHVDADYIAVYAMVLVGYSPDNIVDRWNALYDRKPPEKTGQEKWVGERKIFFSDHGRSRLKQLPETVLDVTARVSAGRPVVPSGVVVLEDVKKRNRLH